VRRKTHPKKEKKTSLKVGQKQGTCKKTIRLGVGRWRVDLCQKSLTRKFIVGARVHDREGSRKKSRATGGYVKEPIKAGDHPANFKIQKSPATKKSDGQKAQRAGRVFNELLGSEDVAENETQPKKNGSDQFAEGASPSKRVGVKNFKMTEEKMGQEGGIRIESARRSWKQTCHYPAS